MKIWRTAIRLVLILLAVGLVLLILYGLWRVFRLYWAAILFWGYCVVALLVVVMIYLFMLRLKRLDNQEGAEMFTQQIINATKETTWLQRLRGTAAGIASALAAALAWPLTITLALIQRQRLPEDRRTKLLSQSAQERLNPAEAQIAAGLLLAVAGLYAAHWLLGPPERFGRGLLLLVAAACTARLVYYAVNTVSLPAQLRRSPRSPYVGFVIVAVCSFGVLVLCFAGHKHGVRGVGYEQLKETALDLIKFRKAFAFYAGEEIAPVDYFLTAAGFLYYITIFQTLRSFDKFKRVDEDIHALAQSYIALGKYDVALSWLAKVQHKNQTTYALRAAAYFGGGVLAKALGEAKKGYYADREEHLDESGSYHQTVSIALLVYIPAEHVLNLLEEWLARAPRESLIVDALDGLVGQGKISPDSYGQLLAKDGRAEKHPLLFCHQRVLAGDFAGARELLEAMPPGDGIAEVLRRFLLLKSHILNPETTKVEDAVSINDWAAQHLPAVKEMALKLTDDQEIMLIVFQLNFALIFARDVNSGRVQEINSLMQELKGSIKAEDMRLKAERATAYIQTAIAASV